MQLQRISVWELSPTGDDIAIVGDVHEIVLLGSKRANPIIWLNYPDGHTDPQTSSEYMNTAFFNLPYFYVLLDFA